MASKTSLSNKMEMHYRYRCGDTQKKLAAEYGISQPSVSNFIREVERNLANCTFKDVYDTYIRATVGIIAKTSSTETDAAGYPIVGGIGKYTTAVRLLAKADDWTDAAGVFGATGA